MRRLRRHGLRVRLALIAVAVALPLLATIAVGLVVDADDARTEAAGEVSRLADAVAAGLEQTLIGTRSALVVIAASDPLQDFDVGRCTAALSRLLPELPETTNLSSATADGSIWCSAVPVQGPVTISDRDYYQRLLGGASFAVSGYQIGRILGEPVIIGAVPIRTPAGELRGTVQAVITLARVATIVDRIELPDGAAVTVVDRHGVVVARRPAQDGTVGEPLPDSDLRRAILATGVDNPEGAHGGPGPFVGSDGVDRFYGIRGVDSGGDALHVAVGFSVEAANVAGERRFGLGLLVLGLAIIVALVLVLVLARRLVIGPVEALGSAADRIAEGDLAARTGLGGEDEVGRLAHAFDRMADSVQERVALRTTELQAALEERDAAQQRVRDYLDIAVDPLVVVEAIRDDGDVVDFRNAFANEPARDLLGPELGKPGAEVSRLSPDRAAARIRMFAQVLADGRPIEYETKFRHARSGDEVDLLARVTRVGDGVAVAFRDVSAAKRLHRALESARAEADRANRSKTEFLSRMSHELRTPLNAVIGFAQILEMDGLRDDQTESVKHILRGGRHLLDLINEILDISRIESGTLATSPEPVDAAGVVAEAVEIIGALAQERGIDFETRVEREGINVIADRQRIKQILLNLLSNAVKFNREDGRVQIEIRTVEGGRGRISVRDEGPGIEPALRARVFAPFDRLGADQRRIEGTGLGLTLSRALAERMGGRLDYDSIPGTGATFWLELPLASEPDVHPVAPPPALTEAADVSGTVLYIEDNLSNLQLVTRIFERYGTVRVVPAMLGGLGLELARDRPDVILLDLHLPDMDGQEILVRLRADPLTRTLPVIVMSADASPGIVDELTAMGATAFVTKPISIRGLLAIVEPLLVRHPQADDPED